MTDGRYTFSQLMHMAQFVMHCSSRSRALAHELKITGWAQHPPRALPERWNRVSRIIVEILGVRGRQAVGFQGLSPTVPLSVGTAAENRFV